MKGDEDAMMTAMKVVMKMMKMKQFHDDFDCSGWFRCGSCQDDVVTEEEVMEYFTTDEYKPEAHGFLHF